MAVSVSWKMIIYNWKLENYFRIKVDFYIKTCCLTAWFGHCGSFCFNSPVTWKAMCWKKARYLEDVASPWGQCLRQSMVDSAVWADFTHWKTKYYQILTMCRTPHVQYFNFTLSTLRRQYNRQNPWGSGRLHNLPLANKMKSDSMLSLILAHGALSSVYRLPLSPLWVGMRIRVKVGDVAEIRPLFTRDK